MTPALSDVDHHVSTIFSRLLYSLYSDQLFPGPLGLSNQLSPDPLGLSNQLSPDPLDLSNQLSPDPLDLSNQLFRGPLDLSNQLFRGPLGLSSSGGRHDSFHQTYPWTFPGLWSGFVYSHLVSSGSVRADSLSFWSIVFHIRVTVS